MIVRICDSLQRRGYLVWIDLEMMKGSVRSPPTPCCECHLLLRISFEYLR